MSNQLTEEQIWEEVETWVNSLLEEGYDLSEYTWEEMYENYITERIGGAITALRGLVSRPGVRQAARSAASQLKAGAEPVAKATLKNVGKIGAAGAVGLTADELLTRGAGRTLAGKALETSRQLGPALRGEKPSTAKTEPSSPSTGKVVAASGGKGGKVTSGVKYAATLGGKKGNVTYDDSGKKSFTADSYKYNEPFDLVLEYLLSQGHVDTLEEALYVMMEMNSETIQDICESKKWIQKAIKHPGALSKQLDVPEEENIPTSKLKAAAKKGGKIGKRANLAMTLKGLNK